MYGSYDVLISFVNLTHISVIWKETSTEELARPGWPVGMPIGVTLIANYVGGFRPLQAAPFPW